MQLKKWVFLVLLPAVLMLSGCAGSPSASSSFPASAESSAPLWVIDTEKAYPDAEWLSYTGSARDSNSAESTAINGLAQHFRVDVSSIATSNQEFAHFVSNAQGKKVDISVQNREFALEVAASSSVSGLIGLQKETWTAGDGTVYANARMNRRECSDRYRAMIRENENLIRSLKNEAERNSETFDAFQMLNFAFNVAQVTDNLYQLLNVIDPSTTSTSPEYGNAEAVRALAQNAARSIIISVNVEGDDENGRISRAFSSYLNSQGFRTVSGGANSYILSVLFKMEQADFVNDRFRFVSYILNYSLKNRTGLEVFSDSYSGREGHNTVNQARQRALLAAESIIGSEGFAVKFDEYLGSLL